MSQLTEVKNAILNLNLFPLHTRHALLLVALKLYTNYDAKVMKDTCGAHVKVQMKCFFITESERAAKSERTPFTVS